MEKQLLRSHMTKHGDTQAALSNAMGISLSRLNAKINSTRGADFTQSEIAFIVGRYGLTAKELQAVFFNKKVSNLDTYAVAAHTQ